MEVKKQEKDSIRNPKYSKEVNDKVDGIITRCIAQAYPTASDHEKALMITVFRTTAAKEMDELYDFVDEGLPTSLIEALIILALFSVDF